MKQKPNIFGITEDWKNASEITQQPRLLKARVRAYNNLFGEDDDHRFYIVSGICGYKLTVDHDEIMESLEKEEKAARTKFHQASQRRKHVQEFFSRNERLPV